MKIFKSKITKVLVPVIVVVLIICSIVSSILGSTKTIHKVRTEAKLRHLDNGSDFGEIVAGSLAGVILSSTSLKILWLFNGISEAIEFIDDFGSSSYIGSSSTIGGSAYFFDGPSGSINSSSSSDYDFWSQGTTWWSEGNSSSVSGSSSTPKNDSNLDYSTTNVQVQNVDEADVIKTDGEYTYSLSDMKIIITDVRDPQNPNIVARLETTASGSVPEDMMLLQNRLVVMCKDTTKSSYSANTEVNIYDVTDKEHIYVVNSFSIPQKYYSSRIVNGHLYVLASGYLRDGKDNNIDHSYVENYVTKEISLKDMYYFNQASSSYYETVIAEYNMLDDDSQVNVEAYITPTDNIYVSENAIYLIDETYGNPNSSMFVKGILSIFGPKGLFGIVDFMDEDYDTNTIIRKIAIKDDGSTKYVGTKILEGETINQFSFDEKDSNLRVALQDEDGTRIIVLNNKLKEIGRSEAVSKDEDLRSSRFIGDKAYLVTYRTTDPLFVFDLSDPKNPQVKGALKIPGYSTYLHPYDENHIIGIGIDTEEIINRNTDGSVRSTSAIIKGMKIALFDVSNVKNPIQISEAKIGDSSVKSAILTNHKALLFSKEKNLLAIPIQNYNPRDDEIQIDSDDSKKIEDKYNSYYGSDYLSEGYLVYNINLETGITEKGVITHNKTMGKSEMSQQLRGMYIKNHLITISQYHLKINDLDTLEEVSNLEI